MKKNSVYRVDIALEMEEWAERAALVRVAHSAPFSDSGVTSTLENRIGEQKYMERESHFRRRKRGKWQSYVMTWPKLP